MPRRLATTLQSAIRMHQHETSRCTLSLKTAFHQSFIVYFSSHHSHERRPLFSSYRGPWPSGRGKLHLPARAPVGYFPAAPASQRCAVSAAARPDITWCRLTSRSRYGRRPSATMQMAAYWRRNAARARQGYAPRADRGRDPAGPDLTRPGSTAG